MKMYEGDKLHIVVGGPRTATWDLNAGDILCGLKGVLDLADQSLPVHLHHGDCRGVDRIVHRLAQQTLRCDVTPWPANWKEEGKAAGPLRNQRMLELVKPDVVILFQYVGMPMTKGTKDLGTRAYGLGIHICRRILRNIPAGA